MIVVGIDPGLHGAIASFDAKNKKLEVWDMPVSRNGPSKFRVDFPAAISILRPLSRKCAYAMIEEVHAMPGQGVVSMFNFGLGYGGLLGILGTLGFYTWKVRPAVWKTLMGLSSDKKESLAKARAEFPEHQHYFTKAKDDGRAEAALLALLLYQRSDEVKNEAPKS